MVELGDRLRVIRTETRAGDVAPSTSEEPGSRRDWRFELVLIAAGSAGVISTILGTIGGLTGAPWGSPLAFTGLATVAACVVAAAVAHRWGPRMGLHTLFILGALVIVLDSFILRPPTTFRVSIISPLLMAVGILLLVPIRWAVPYLVGAAVGQWWLLARAGIDPIPWMATFASMGLFTAIAAYRRDLIEEALHESASEQTIARRQATELLDNAPVGCCLYDADGRPLRWNKAHAEMMTETLGHPPRSDVPIWEEFPGHMAQQTEQFMRHAAAGNVVEVASQAEGSNPPRRWMTVLTPATHVMGAAVVAMTHEISDADAIVADYKTRLHDARMQLLNIASHDLRTPLTPLKMQVALLSSSRLGPLTPEQARAIDVVHRSTQRLTRHIDNLITAYDLEYRQPEPQASTISVAQVFDDAVVMAERVHGLICPTIGAVDPRLTAHADEALLRRSIVYLLEHAAKDGHGNPSDVILEADVADGVLLVHVHDRASKPHTAPATGRFEPFHEDSMDAEDRVHGLPIHLANKCIEATGGKLAVCPSHAEGCFRLELVQPPLAGTAPTHPFKPPTTPAAARPRSEQTNAPRR